MLLIKRHPSLVNWVVFIGHLAGHVRREHQSSVPWSTEWVSSREVAPCSLTDAVLAIFGSCA